MAGTKPRYRKDEFARRGDTVYEREICPALEADDEGKFVAIDIETGDYEADVDEQSASDRLMARVQDVQIWLRRVGSRFVRRFGGHGPSVSR